MADKFDIEEFWNRLVHSGEHESEPVISEEFDRKYPTLVKAISKEGVINGSDAAKLARNTHYLANGAPADIVKKYSAYRPMKLNDKYKHAVINCMEAQRGLKGVSWAQLLSGLKEYYDVQSGNNTQEESDADMDANLTGRFLGIKYPEEDCDELVQRYIKKLY